MTAAAKQMPPDERHRANTTVVALIFVAMAADVAILIAAAKDLAPISALIVAHALIGPTFWAVSRTRGETTIATMGMVTMAIMGPLGALGTLMLAIGSRRQEQRQPDHEWYGVLAAHAPKERDLPNELWQSLAEGRARESSVATVQDFRQVMSKGSLAEKQAMLGLISKRFDPAYAGVLKEALRSEEPVIRVSAAAVYSKLRETNRKQMIVEDGEPQFLLEKDALKRGFALASGAYSGLLDFADAERARQDALELLIGARPIAKHADAVEELICRLLMDAHREAEIEHRLTALDISASATLRDIRLRTLMKAGNYAGVAEAMVRKRSNPIRLDRLRYYQDGRALLSSSETSDK